MGTSMRGLIPLHGLAHYMKVKNSRHNSAQLATRGQQLCNFWQQWMPGTWVLERSGFGLVWLR